MIDDDGCVVVVGFPSLVIIIGHRSVVSAEIQYHYYTVCLYSTKSNSIVVEVVTSSGTKAVTLKEVMCMMWKIL